LNKEIAEKNKIFEVVVGSHSYGTALPTSDYDSRGVFVPPKKYLLGLARYNPKNEFYDFPSVDSFLFSLQKFCKLCAAFNPNVIEILWTDKECLLFSNEAGQRLVNQREIFNSKMALKSYGGYASGQVKRLMNKSGRCGDRWKVVEEFGYDTKHGMHIIRLLEMGAEFLRTGILTPKRPNADYLNDIRYGKVSHKDLMEQVAELENDLDKAHQESTLPESPDYAAIDKLLIETTEEHWQVIEAVKGAV